MLGAVSRMVLRLPMVTYSLDKPFFALKYQNIFDKKGKKKDPNSFLVLNL
jgi:hypothetical protein